jgi:hypothetical protein
MINNKENRIKQYEAVRSFIQNQKEEKIAEQLSRLIINCYYLFILK